MISTCIASTFGTAIIDGPFTIYNKGICFSLELPYLCRFDKRAERINHSPISTKAAHGAKEGIQLISQKKTSTKGNQVMK